MNGAEAVSLLKFQSNWDHIDLVAQVSKFAMLFQRVAEKLGPVSLGLLPASLLEPAHVRETRRNKHEAPSREQYRGMR